MLLRKSRRKSTKELATRRRPNFSKPHCEMRRYFSIFLLGVCSLSSVLAQEEDNFYEYIPDVPDSVIEARLKAIENEVSLEFTEAVKSHIQFYTITRRDYARKMLNRSTKYFPIYEEYLAKHNMPDELKYLSIVESGLHPNAVSHAAAVGLWQFIYFTGKKYGLESDWYIDDRMDPEMSTEAACRFLKFLHGYFGDWELALAGYNSGPGRVNRAIRYADGQRDFWAIYDYLPRETKAYVPKFVAVMYVFNYAEEHNLFPDESLYLPEADTLHVSQFMNVEEFAKVSGLCLEDIELLNPQIKHSAIPATAKNYPLRIPKDLKDSIVLKRKELYDLANVGRAEIEKLAANEVGAVAGRERVLYKVKSGDVLGTIAQRHHVRVSDIKKWNRMSSNMIKIGQTLKIWVLPKYKNAASQPIAKKETMPPPTPKPGQKTHLVSNGDTLWDISLAHKISIEEIKSLNNLQNNNIKPGQTLIVSQ